MTATASTGYVAISRRTLDLEDYIDLARRHAAWILGPLFAGLVISTVVAFVVPNTYVSVATLQITPKQISDNIVKTTVTQELTERISEMQQEILSRTQLAGIITDPRLDLYKSERARLPLDDVIETMRTRDLRISISQVPGEKRASAFSISFSYPDRVKAHDTVQALVAKFLEANVNSQRNLQNMLGSFVGDEMKAARTKLDDLNKQLMDFRAQNAGRLPEQEGLNIAQMTAWQQRLSTTNDSLAREAQERVTLDARLATLESQRALSDSLDQEVDSLPAPVQRQNQRLLDLNKQITETETALARSRKVFKPGYPDIRDAESNLEDLKKQRDELQKQQDAELAKPAGPTKKITNFNRAQAITNIEGQITQTKALVKALEMQETKDRTEQQETTRKLGEFQTRLAGTSGIEARAAELMSEVKDAREKYQVLQQKQELAEQSGQLLERKAGENLDQLDPPSLPVQPAKPNRWMIVGGGVGIGFVLGLALAGLQEAKDTSLKNLKDVRAYTNLPVLSSIPLLENTMLVRRKRRLTYLAWSAAVIVGILAVCVSLYWHYTYAV